MTKNEALKAIEDYMGASLGVNAEITEKAKEAIKVLKADGWVPIEERLPEVDANGESRDYMLLSFANASLPCIGDYRVDEEGNGAFYDGDDDRPLLAYGLIINAWRPLPGPYRPEGGEG